MEDSVKTGITKNDGNDKEQVDDFRYWTTMRKIARDADDLQKRIEKLREENERQHNGQL